MKIKSFLIICLSFLALSQMQASHYSTGYITYRYIGNLPGQGPHTYEVELGIYRNINGIAIGTANSSVVISGSQYSSSHTLQYQQPGTGNAHPNDPDGWAIDFHNACGRSDAAGNWSLYLYRGVVQLPGKDIYTMVPNLACCRDVSDNLLTTSALGIYAKLNNLHGPNSMPTPKHEVMLADLCINKQFEVFGYEPDPDGGLLNYTPSYPLDGDLLAVPWDSGFSKNKPLPVAPNGYYVNPQTGVATIKPTGVGTFAIPLHLQEVKQDSAGEYYTAGEMHLETKLAIQASCDSVVSAGPTLSFGNNVYSRTDSCGIQSLRFKVSGFIEPSTLDTNGTEFRAANLQGQPVPITSASLVSDDTIEIGFHNPLSANQTIRIYNKPGIDGDILINSCGFETTATDTFELIIQGCSEVGIDETPDRLKFYPNPSKGLIYLTTQSGEPLEKVEVYNPSGKRVYEVNHPGSQINLQLLPDGLYLLRGHLPYGNVEQHRVLLQSDK